MQTREVNKILNEVIRKEGSKWVLYSKDGNRVLGRHDTKKEAEAQETAINISKAKN